MAETTGISWTDSTFNPWIGCTKVSPGCEHCYAEALDKRHRWKGAEHWGPGVERMRTSENNWRLPRQWNKQASQFYLQKGRRRRVFCASLADVFDNEVPENWQRDLFGLIQDTPELDWLLLTKRIGNVRGVPLPENVWLGISVVNQEEASRDVPKLMTTPARTRFLSCEPLLGPIDLRGLWTYCPVHDFPSGFCVGPCPDRERIDWVIVGGESGPRSRVMRTEWVYDIKEQCEGANVPFFFKQWGGGHPSKGGCNLGGAEAKAWPTTA